ncbi:rod shape-determining protein MreC [Streptococcus halichoeri]|uniref:rod shape-determining protein MreC n=1 Tax=Streptococcus halichoeri TaxID=254785 RepID=UPI000DB4CE70|nr:rod shape-determining protein MreC [Streptococcus halichoeri]PZO93373.1 MAG: rod shape-determining protein MreC [Streptococcus pyogenes]
MNKFKISRFFFILTILFICLSFLFLLVKESFSPYLSSLTQSSLSRVDQVISRPIITLQEISGEAKSFINTYNENKELKASLATSKRDAVSVRQLTSENRELKALLGIDYKQSFQKSAEVIVRTPKTWGNTMRIALGKRQGVQKGMLVSTSKGLIGVINQVTPHFSDVALLTSGQTFHLPIKINDGKRTIFGSLNSYDSAANLISSSEYNSNTPISIGTTVYSSGLDGKSPSDIPIGKVVRTVNDDDKLKRKIMIQLFDEASDVNYVSVVGK